MARLAKDGAEALLLFLLTFSLYLLFMVTAPILREPHGLLIMAEDSDLARHGLILELFFGSAGVCVILGALVMNWAHYFPAGVMANLWATTYFFIWIDSAYTLSAETKSYHYLTALAIGLAFIYLFFFLLNYLGAQPEEVPAGFNWKVKVVDYWIWGWMGFYLGLSGFLAFHSIQDTGARLPLAAGAMVVCFLNYLLNLFLRKSQGKDIHQFSRVGRIVFIVWALFLLLLWIGSRWLV